MQRIHQRSETKPEKKTRKILAASYNKCEKKLPNLSREELKDLYTHLRNPEIPASQKNKKLYHIATLHSSLMLPENGRENDITDERELSRQVRKMRHSSWSWKDELSKQTSNLAFYGSAISEHYFYQFSASLLCTYFGINTPLTAGILSYGGAAILSILSYLFEETSVQKYYEAVFQRCLGSPHSASNPLLRRGIGVKSFFMGGLLALSECYPAWSASLSSSSASWPLLAFMIARRHASNALWLQQGYDRSISDWHSRDCSRDTCRWKSCNRGEEEQEMINYISRAIHKLLHFQDHLNAEGIIVLYNSHFGHAPKHD